LRKLHFFCARKDPVHIPPGFSTNLFIYSNGTEAVRRACEAGRRARPFRKDLPHGHNISVETAFLWFLLCVLLLSFRTHRQMSLSGLLRPSESVKEAYSDAVLEAMLIDSIHFDLTCRSRRDSTTIMQAFTDVSLVAWRMWPGLPFFSNDPQSIKCQARYGTRSCDGIHLIRTPKWGDSTGAFHWGIPVGQYSRDIYLLRCST
jgi:hypothetical protein